MTPESIDLRLAQLACLDIYSGALHVEITSGVAYSVVRPSDYDVIVFRGSDTVRDWFRDFEAHVVYVAGLGHVHRGFYSGLRDVLAKVRDGLKPVVYVTGHSLGGGEAPIFSLMLEQEGLAPRACVAFAPPRPGYEDFRDTLCLTGVELRGYANDGDPVPHVPEPILPLLPWAHAIPDLMRFAVPADPDDREPLRCHHGRLYYQGVKQLLGGA